VTAVVVTAVPLVIVTAVTAVTAVIVLFVLFVMLVHVVPGRLPRHCLSALAHGSTIYPLGVYVTGVTDVGGSN
jgi:hypothetical protein